MKVRVLWVPPSERDLKPGEVYDLEDGAEFVERKEAEAVDEKTPAAKDPRGAAAAAAEAAASKRRRR